MAERQNSSDRKRAESMDDKDQDDIMNDEFSIETPQESPRDKKVKSASAENSPANSPRKENVPNLMVASSPPKFVSLEEIMKAASGVSNMKLAHEIVLEDDFKLVKEDAPADSMEKKVKEIMHKAFWDVLEEKMKEDPPDYTHAIVLLEEIKENLLGLLLPHQKTFKGHITDVLDSKLIEQKLEHNAFDMSYYSNFVISVLAKLCAPARDEEIEKLKSIQEVVPLYKEIFAVLDLMKVDMANFTIQQMKPYIQQQSVEYERKKFNDLLAQQKENGLDGLQFTKSWLRRSADKVYQKANASGDSSASSSSNPSPKVSPAVILNTAFLEVLEWDDEIMYPDTLVIDRERFTALRDSAKWLGLVSSILLVTYNTVGGPIAGTSELKKTLKEQISAILADTQKGHLEEALVNVAEQINKEVMSSMTTHGFPRFDESKQELLKGQIKALVTDDHPVRKLMKGRLLSFVMTLVSAAKPNQIQIPAGYGALSEEVNKMCGKFMKIVSYNKAVFGYHYGDIIAALITEKTGSLN